MIQINIYYDLKNREKAQEIYDSYKVCLSNIIKEIKSLNYQTIYNNCFKISMISINESAREHACRGYACHIGYFPKDINPEIKNFIILPTIKSLTRIEF